MVKKSKSGTFYLSIRLIDRTIEHISIQSKIRSASVTQKGALMIKKKLLSLLLVGGLVTSLLPLDTFAMGAEEVRSEEAKDSMAYAAGKPIPISTGISGSLSKEEQDKRLEKVLLLVKKKISIPTDLKNFDYYYNDASYYEGSYWNLSWYNDEYSKYITVQADEAGNIRSYYNRSSEKNYSAPKYLKDELKGEAEQFIKKVAPDIFGRLQYAGKDAIIVDGNSYRYTFYRVENGVLLPDNAVIVGVNFGTGKINSYNASYSYGITIPKKEVKLTADEAKEVIRKQVKMQLTYQSSYDYSGKNGGTTKAFLVYSPDVSYIAVDAKTGKVYTSKSEWITKPETGYGINDEEAKADGGLSEIEIKEIENLKNIITKEEAINKVLKNKYLYIDSNAKAVNARLTKQSSKNKEDTYRWEVSFSDPREVDYDKGSIYRAYGNATVDGKTGTILSFYTNVKDYSEMTEKELNNFKAKYDIKEGQSALEKFIKEQIPKEFAGSEFLDNKVQYMTYWAKDKEMQVLRSYYYNYNRVNEGIPYYQNQINGSVDVVTGKVISFSYNWDKDIVFEAPKNVMSEAEAFKHYMSKEGYGLNYEINVNHFYGESDYKMEQEVRLVYNTNIYPNYISPFTGKQLDYDGKEYIKEGLKYNYNDISGNPMERKIKLLADIGIGFEGGSFQTEKGIKGSELAELVGRAGYYIKNESLANQDKIISRLDATRELIKMLNYEKVAGIKGIYQLDMADKGSILEKDIGAVAIIDGLNLITDNDQKEFRGSANLTRGESVQLILELMEINER